MMRAVKFAWQVLQEAGRRFDRDYGTFLASGLAFDLMLCILPFLLVLLSLSGYVLESSEQMHQDILAFLERALPVTLSELQHSLQHFIKDRKIIGAVGLISLLLAASRVFGGIRTVIEISFRRKLPFNYVTGKLFDIGMVVLTGALLFLSLGFSYVITDLQNWLTSWLSGRGYDFSRLNNLIALALAFAASTGMFFLVYRLPLERHVPTRIVMTLALLVAALWELAKWLFGLYLANLGRFDVLYGSFGVLVILVLWIYYSAIIFVAGAELGSAWHDLRQPAVAKAAPARRPDTLRDETGRATRRA
ncbi:MAG: YihY/virulence factor BrkB family protein [candidate division KSB1 bacterium]|nr:YihY/virulence factor BrkB family protein [candidate division KSB1 bacterium]MDZ7273141.1 YihY/virulence factor BrkB family protein [candidate division KSB1 bacterium]MDZ7285243.1 YihY/virulence factor BrkB family protein [candidate division KSB1 bacterium]MDZ7298275.1 YihY/virulence factor BrkB family protein [candidate division KSB1 bacterium]MDZ7306644.1 YihY/virulence factor BrkB family protein [candidate division KSB1 bacterium]